MLGWYLGGEVGAAGSASLPPEGTFPPLRTLWAAQGWARGAMGRSSRCSLSKQLRPRGWLSPSGRCIAQISGQGRDFVVALAVIPLRAGQAQKGCRSQPERSRAVMLDAFRASPFAVEPAGLLLMGK